MTRNAEKIPTNNTATIKADTTIPHSYINETHTIPPFVAIKIWNSYLNRPLTDKIWKTFSISDHIFSNSFYSIYEITSVNTLVNKLVNNSNFHDITDMTAMNHADLMQLVNRKSYFYVLISKHRDIKKIVQQSTDTFESICTIDGTPIDIGISLRTDDHGNILPDNPFGGNYRAFSFTICIMEPGNTFLNTILSRQVLAPDKNNRSTGSKAIPIADSPKHSLTQPDTPFQPTIPGAAAMAQEADTYTDTVNTTVMPIDKLDLYRPRNDKGEYTEPAIRPWVAKKIWEVYTTGDSQWNCFGIGSYIDGGSFGSVYQIHNLTNNESFCIKISRIFLGSQSANNSEKDACAFLKESSLPNTIKYISEPRDITISLNYKVIHAVGKDYVEFLNNSTHSTHADFSFTVYIMSLYNESLTALRDRNDRISEDRIIQIGIDISKSLATLHDRRIIHTDVKPGNILVNNQPGAAHPSYSLADFNSMANMRDEGSLTYTAISEIRYTPAYADPLIHETVRRPEFDIYCLASTLYWCCNEYKIEPLVGQALPDGPCDMSYALYGNVPVRCKYRERPKNISDGLWEILSKAMDVDLNSRYKSADEFREALEDFRRRRESNAGQTHGTKGISRRVQIGNGKSRAAKIGDKIFYTVCFVMIVIGLLARLSFAGKFLPGTAHNIAGYVYSEGIFLEQNAVHAARLYSEGANMDNARCAYNLGKMYYHGKGVEESHTDAAFWYLKSANLGFAPAQFETGRAFEYGDGVRQDYEQAVKFYSLAVDQGHKEAKENLNKLQEKIANRTRPTTEDREGIDANTYLDSNGNSATYVQILNPAPQDFICQIYECTETDIFTSWNSLGYSFNAVSKELTLHLNYRDNRKIYNTMTATFSSSPFTDAAIKEAVSLYPDLWAADSPSNTQLLKEFSLGIPLENWTSETAYILLLNMGKDYEVLSYTIIKVSNIPINGMPISDWVEIQGSMHYMHNIGLDVNYSLGTTDSADIVASYSDNDGETWTMLDEVTVSVDEQSTGKTWLWVDLDKLTNNILDAPDYQYKVYMHPKERDDSWTPLASSQPVDSHL